MKIYFRVPYPKNLNFEFDLPATPRIGESIEAGDKGTFSVVNVVWFLDNDENSPYVILQ